MEAAWQKAQAEQDAVKGQESETLALAVGAENLTQLPDDEGSCELMGSGAGEGIRTLDIDLGKVAL